MHTLLGDWTRPHPERIRQITSIYLRTIHALHGPKLIGLKILRIKLVDELD